MGDHAAKTPLLVTSNQLYDGTKQFTTIVLPAAIAFYVTLGNIWHWALIPEISASLAGLGVFLGVLLTIGKKQYDNSDASKDGALNVDPNDEDNPIANLRLDEITASDLANKDTITLKVNDLSSQE